MQAPPSLADLRRFIPPDELWPPGPAWAYHGAELEKLWHYAQPFLDADDPTLQGFVSATQRAQCHGLQVAIEHYRRRKADGCGGVLVWQFNEPWPAISWSLLGFSGRPKPAYEVVKRLLSPVLVSLEYSLTQMDSADHLTAKVWIINDTPELLSGCQVEVVLWDVAQQPVRCMESLVEAAAGSANVVGNICWTVPADHGSLLNCRLSRGGDLLASNEYDLTVHDSLEPTLRPRLRTKIRSLVRRIR
jgi:beta-mannosidase